MRIVTCALVALTLSFLTGSARAQPEVRRLYQEATEALRMGDAATYLNRFQQAYTFRENSPLVMLRIAEGHTLTGDKDAAFEWLNRIAKLGVSMPLAQNKRLESLFADPRFDTITERMRTNEAPIAVGVPALTLPLRGWIFEAVAKDPQSGDLFLSSVRRRQILRVNAAGERKAIAGKKDGLLGVTGLALDLPSRTLYTVSAPQPHMDDFQADGQRRAELISIPLDSEKPIRHIPLPDETEAPSPGDLTLDREGNVYISDGQRPAIYRWRKGAAKAELWFTDERFSSLQGLVLFEAQHTLLVADYSRGLWRIDLRTKAVEPLKPPADVTLTGLDGLARYEDSVIATQNGVSPARVLRVHFNDSKTVVNSVEILERNHPAWDEPTLGCIQDHAFYYIANSQWNRFDENGNVTDEDALKNLTVLRLPLH